MLSSRLSGGVRAARALAALAVLALLAGCGARGDDPAAGPASPAPAAESTPEPEPEPEPAALPEAEVVADGPDGELLGAEELPAPDGARAWRVRYRSRAVDGSPVAVSGLVVRPAGPAPEGGFPVLTWGHGTTGTADACAPSRSEGLPIPELPELLDAGFVVAASDYEGLGTPGVHPYLVGESAGRSLLDAARAAARVPGADAGARVIAHGESQGGHAALFAGEIAPRYAPELDLLGVVAAAPPADVPALIGGASASPLTFGYAFLVFATWSATYPEADLTAVVTPEVAERAAVVEQGCLDVALRAFPGLPLDRLRAADPMTVQPWADLLERNRAGTVAPPAPVLIVHGEADRLIPVELSSELRDRLCGLGAQVALETYPGAGHGVVPAASGDITAWLSGRLSGQPAPTSC